MPSTISAGTSSGTALNLSGDTTGNLAFQTNGTTTAMTITTSQNVGIGTTSPAVPLAVYKASDSAINIQNSTSGVTNVDGLQLLLSGANGYMWNYENGANIFGTNNTERMRINNSGDVGIGTNGPSYKLDVRGTIGTNNNITIEDSSNVYGLVIGRGRILSNGAGGFGGLTFQTYNGAFANQMFIDGNGQVGIGTNSPSQKLQVQGVINFATVNAGQTGVGAGFQDGATMFLGSDFQDPNGMSGTTNASFKFSTSRTGCIAASNNGSYVYEGFTSATGSRSFAVLSNGNVQNTNNSYGSLSDATIKQDIVDAGSQWNDIKNLKVRKYRFIEEVAQNPDAKPQIGLVAQEAETISPGLVDKQTIYKQKLDSDGNTIPDAYGTPEMEVDKELKTIKYSVLYMKAVKALQEAMERIETLEAKVNALEGAK